MPRPPTPLRLPSRALLGVLVLVVVGAVASAGETPSAGPPWVDGWVAAKRAALARGRPIFAYFTKKH